MELRSARLRLTPLDPEADAAGLHLAYGDPQVSVAWLDEDPPKDQTETRKRLMTHAAVDGSRLWTIRLLNDPDALGLVELVGSGATPWLTWMLRREHWRRGITGEAVAAVVEHLMAAEGVERVEAWADAANLGSIGVARRAGLSERGRFMLSSPLGGTREKVVLGRTRGQENQAFYAAHPVLPVRDVEACVRLLCDGLGLTLGFRIGEPTQYASLRLGPWTMGPSLRLDRTDDEQLARMTPVTVAVDSGVRLSGLEARFIAAGGRTEGPVHQMAWGAYELCCLLPEGHRLLIGGWLA